MSRPSSPQRSAQTARKSATVGKPAAAKRSGISAKPDEKAHGGVDPIVVTESEDVPGPSRSKQPPRKSAVPQLKPVNGAVKGKGKVQGLQRDDPIDLEPTDDVSDVSDIETLVPVPRQRSSPDGSSSVPSKDEALQRKLLQGQKTIESLRKQVDELLKVQTDQQQALESWKARQEASNGAYKYYRQAVEESRRLAASLDTGSSPLLPREIVEEERKAANQGIEQLKQDIKVKDEQLRKAETRILELQESEALLRSDLKVEIERSKTLTGRAGSKPPNDANQRHQAAVTTLYEDMTNILITGVKFEMDPQIPGGSTNYQCVYTQRSETTARSIRFQLRVWRETDKDDQENVHVRYTPLDLDKEPAQFREKLDFMGSTFAFERDQIQVFFEQLKERIAEAVGAEVDVIEVLSDG